ncbi:MAG: hypothetical protein AAGA54_09215 [Myxococcota bacterium]
MTRLRPEMLLLSLACACGGGSDDGSASGFGTTATASATAGGDSTGGGSGPGSATQAGDDGGEPQTSGGDASSGADASSSGGDADATSGQGGSEDTGGGETLTGGETEGGGDTGGSSDESTGGEPLSDDPFDPAACNGVAWTGDEALAQLAGLPREVLATATIQVRTRTCPGGACGDWGPGEDWVISYLTWSGGVTTAYTDLMATMNLVLFDDDGTPRLSMQHETFPIGGYPDDDGVLYGFPPETVSYPHLRAFNQFPESEYYYEDLDYQVAAGELLLGEGCAVFTANPFGTGQPYTAQYAAVFHW